MNLIPRTMTRGIWSIVPSIRRTRLSWGSSKAPHLDTFNSFFHFHFFCLSKILFDLSQGTYSVLEAKQIHPSVSCSKAIFYFYYIHIFNILELHHLTFSTLTCFRSLLTGRDVKGNTPFHIAARMNGSLGNFLKDFVNLYSDKVFLFRE